MVGDFNATVSDPSGAFKSVIGPVTPDSLNENGTRLLQLCTMHELVSTNTLFHRKDIHKSTWYSNDGRTRKMIDYIIVNQRWRSSVTNCRTYRCAEIGNTDHRLVAANFRLRLKAQPTERRQPKLDTQKLKTEEFRQKYLVEVQNRFECLNTLVDPDTFWQTYKNM